MEVLTKFTHGDAQLLALSGPRSPYPGKLGVVETAALADLLLLDGDPVLDLDLVADPGKTVIGHCEGWTTDAQKCPLTYPAVRRPSAIIPRLSSGCVVEVARYP